MKLFKMVRCGILFFCLLAVYHLKVPLVHSEDVIEPSEPARPFQPFYIFLDQDSRQNHYVPSGFMPNGKCIGFDDSWTKDCHGQTCIRIQYDLECSRKDE